MIDMRKLKELVRLMVANDLTEIDLRDTEEQVTVRRPSTMAVPQYAAPIAVAAPAAVAVAPAAAAPPATTEEELPTIDSPMVGTFYSAATPDATAFVTVGDSVSEDSVVCIVEAMKIFNEIKAECNGTIASVLVKNGEAIEFGQPLFTVRT